jgi:outer membrane receptor protein involved in Fe transport
MKTILLTLLVCLSAVAQNVRTVSGKIYDEKGETLPFVNVLLFKSNGTSFYKAVASDEDGGFVFDQVDNDSYYVKVTSVGFMEWQSEVFEIKNQSFELGKIVLAENAKMLEAVQVRGKKPFVEQHIDKMVLNVENSIVSSGSTALEILEKAPGVTVDRQNDQIKIKNKTGVVVMIDGKITYMSEEALAQYLNNLTSDQIESIEIITQPSSKYEAAGNSGIINIKLKKNKNFGTNGSVSASAASGWLPDSDPDLFRGNLNLNLNHRNKKWNLFGNGNIGRSRFYSDNDIKRTTTYAGVTTEFDQHAERVGTGKIYSIRGGADYLLSDRTTLGVQGDFNGWDGFMVGDGLTKMREIRGGEAFNSYLLPTSERDMFNANFSGNFNLRHKMRKAGGEISFDLDYSGFRADSKQELKNEYYSVYSKADSVTRQYMVQPTDIDLYSAKLDFVYPANENLKYEWGLKSSFVDTDNNFKYQNWVLGNWETDLNRTNHFVYKEYINAGYVNASYKWKNWYFQGGLRLEHTISDGESFTTKERNKRDYLNLFPTLFVQQKLNDNNSLRYSYSRRIDRPNYQQLNPFMFILDPYTYIVGNPFLKPQFTDSYEFTYTFKDQYSAGLSFSDTKDLIFQVLEQDDATKTTYQTNSNLKGTQNYSVNFSAPYAITKWWNSQNSLNVFYQHYKDADVAGASLNKGKVAYNFNTNHSFLLPKNWSAELSMWFNSPALYGIIEVDRPQYAVNGGIQKSFPQKNSKLKLSFSDLFLTSFFGGKINYANMNVDLGNRWTSRRISLTYTWNFGNQNVKVSRRSTGNDDLKRRAASDAQ